MDAVQIEKESYNYAMQFENLPTEIKFQIKKAVEHGIRLAERYYPNEAVMQQEIDDNSIMPFGKFKGKKMVNIPAHYFLWLYDNGCSHEGVKKYIINNLDGLRKEAGRK